MPRDVTTTPSDLILDEYTVWNDRKLVDPRGATHAQFADGMSAIISDEGPVMALKIFQTFCKAAEVNRVGPAIRPKFERALHKMIDDGVVIAENELNDDDIRTWIIRMPDQPTTRVRTLGDRGFGEIPLAELAEVLLEIRAEHELIGREELYRAVLAKYELIRMTNLVERRLDKALSDYF